MKLISCHIDNFGGLHDYDFTFSESLNVVLQENGWGKTTMAAFLKAMLYGFESKRTKDITENERRRYLPWQGGAYGGSLDFEVDGRKLRVQRTFGEVPRLDRIRVIDLDKKTTAKIDPDSLGESIFHLDSSAFQRSVFISPNGISTDSSASSSIHTRLNALVSQANDLAVFDESITKLSQQMKIYEKTGNRGQLGDISRQIAERERQRDQLEIDISQQDSARERIRQIDTLLRSIIKDLEEKKKHLDQVTGEAKKQEASKILLDDINLQIEGLQSKIETIVIELGGSIPTAAQIDKAKEQRKAIVNLKEQIESLEKSNAKLTAEYAALIEKYKGTLPTASQMDEIQSIYGELHGILSTDSEEESSNAVEPECYAVIKAAVESDAEYPTKLKQVVASEATLQKLLGQIVGLDADIRHETAVWEEKQTSYKALKADADQLQAEVEKKIKYEKAAIRPAIETLEDLQKKTQLVELRNGELAQNRLTADEESLLKQFSGGAPNIADGGIILEKHRNALRLKSEADGLTYRLDGETSRAASLEASIEQLRSIPNAPAALLKKPTKSSGSVMMGSGAVLAVAGTVLTLMFSNPIMAVVILVGVVFVVLGIANKWGFKAKNQAYEESVAKIHQNADAFKKKIDLKAQLESSQATCSSIKQQIEDLQASANENQSAVLDWMSNWAPGCYEVNENSISMVIDRARKLQQVLKKQRELTDKDKFIKEATAVIVTERKSIDASYPENAGLTITEALKALRDAETDYAIKSGQLETAINKKARLIKELDVAEDQVLLLGSPKAAKLHETRKRLQQQTDQLVKSVNTVLGLVGLSISAEVFTDVLTHAENIMNGFLQYEEKKRDKAGRVQRKRQQVEQLQNKYVARIKVLQGRYEDQEMPERLALVRDEVNSAYLLRDKIKEIITGKEKLTDKLNDALLAIDTFCRQHAHFTADAHNVLSEIIERASNCVELETARQQLEKQKASFVQDNDSSEKANAGEDEIDLRSQISVLDENRDKLLVEYTQKNSFIRQADQSLEKYPDVVQEIHQLYDEKQKAQNNLATLKRTIQLITNAKENLATRYLGKVEQLFNNYMHIWLNNDAVRGILDIDFNVTIEEKEKVHAAEGYSTGYCAMIDFCMRLALVDTLFESEQPFLILDDPFVNLDEDRLDKALELLNVMATNKQIIYFVCHPIRAIEKDAETSFRREFIKLAEATRQTISDRKVSMSGRSKIIKKPPREMYKVVNLNGLVALKPENANFIITNNIFSLYFKLINPDVPNETSFELFFIDAVGHVLGDRQLIEVRNGKLSSEKIQFCLNTRDDSGDQYELMIRESNQDDYEILDRIPFRAKLAFTGTHSFDF